MYESKPKLQSSRDWLWFLFCGLCVGASDIVPGVSGGTIAFIMGFYEDLIENVRSIIGRRATSWSFLIALGTGIVISLVVFSNIIHHILGHELYRIFLYSVFIGLILGSIAFCFKQVGEWQPRQMIALALGIVTAFLLTGSVAKMVGEGRYEVSMELDLDRKVENYDAERAVLTGVSEKMLSAMFAKGAVKWDTKVYDREKDSKGFVSNLIGNHSGVGIDVWMIACGVIGICAMLLPGVSGSYMMLILGMYPVIIGAIADSVTGDLHSIMILVNLGIGIVLGALLFSQVVSWLFRHYHAMTVALLTGFMIGALRAVWPFWTYVYWLNPLKLSEGPQLDVQDPYFPSLIDPVLWGAVGFAVVGFFVIRVIESQVETGERA